MSLLEVKHLNKTFGGLRATHDVSFDVSEGDLAAIIGPNGAGKSTLFNLLTGYHRPDSGDVIFNGQSLLGVAPHDVVRMGVVRSFQRSNIFPRLTVFENVQTAVISHHRTSQNLWRPTKSFGKLNAETNRILASIGLHDKRDKLSGALALGDQKRLEIGLALALAPKLLLLDEPTAGMSPEETGSTVALVKQVADEYGVTLLFTEHDMAVVFRIAESIRVLHQGRIIASGMPQEIADNEEVRRIYLGSDTYKSRFRAAFSLR